MSAIDDIASYVSNGGKLPVTDRKSLSSMVKELSDSHTLTKLQRVASEQLAALVSVYHANEDMTLQISESDVVQDETGHYQRLGQGFAYYCSPTASRERFRLVTSPETLIARMAMRYAKALLEITE